VQGILVPDDDDPVGYTYKIPFLTGAVLSGVALGQSDMLKLDKTMLAEVLESDIISSELY
tara:strand:+ start:97 stop:276 length:180 start_codon:yes stop_codon:yes gene_type:complete